jgi:hypothetical protein
MIMEKIACMGIPGKPDFHISLTLVIIAQFQGFRDLHIILPSPRISFLL